MDSESSKPTNVGSNDQLGLAPERDLVDRLRGTSRRGLYGDVIEEIDWSVGQILETLRKQFGADEAAINGWCGTWIAEGFDALEALLAADTRRGAFCVGDAPTLADVYLVPQVESARRFKVDLARWPLIAAVEAACLQLPAFQKAAPSQQPDAA